MKNAVVMAPALLLLWGAGAIAQDSLTVNQPVERETAPGTAHSYTIHLNAGEYVAGWVDQRGITTLAVVAEGLGARRKW